MLEKQAWRQHFEKRCMQSTILNVTESMLYALGSCQKNIISNCQAQLQLNFDLLALLFLGGIICCS